MASAGAAMAIHRIDAVKVMQEAILARPEGAFPKALIDLDGAFELHAADGMALTDIEQEIVARFGIRSLPTIVLFKDGQPVDGFSGTQPPPPRTCGLAQRALASMPSSP